MNCWLSSHDDRSRCWRHFAPNHINKSFRLVPCCKLYPISIKQSLKLLSLYCLSCAPCDPTAFTMDRYISILIAIATVSTYVRSCSNWCLSACSETWDNGRKGCCQGQGNPNDGWHGSVFVNSEWFLAQYFFGIFLAKIFLRNFFKNVFDNILFREFFFAKIFFLEILFGKNIFVTFKC